MSLLMKTADGIAKMAIKSNGQTTQVDLASPIKHTLSMSMLTQWLTISDQIDKGSCREHKYFMSNRAAPHMLADDLKDRLTCVMSTYNSILFATSRISQCKLIKFSED